MICYNNNNNTRRPQYQGSSYVPGYSNPFPAGAGAGGPPPPQAGTGQLQTQQIYIPNDLVGCIIGKGGAKINEIRHLSASNIKIMEPGATGTSVNGVPAPQGGENERLVVITGQPHNIHMAVQLLYQVRGFLFFSILCGTPHTELAFIAVGSGEAKAVARCQQLGLVS